MQLCYLRCLLVPGDHRVSNGCVYRMGLRQRCFLLLKFAASNAFSVLCDVLMLADDVLYPEHRAVDLSESVFIVGSFRTGSTSLHRYLSMDEDRYASPLYFELFFPFLCLWRFKEFVDRVVGHERTGPVYARLLDAYFGRFLGPEVTSRHPMTGYEAEEDDLLLGSWHKVGWYAVVGFPHPAAWTRSGRTELLSERERGRSVDLYERTMRKMLLHRALQRRTTTKTTRTPVLLSKSHQTWLASSVRSRHPRAKIVVASRHPKDAFRSWYGLAQAALARCAKGEMRPRATAVAAHLGFWDRFAKEELDLLRREGATTGDRSSPDGAVTSVVFSEFVGDHVGTIERLYRNWGALGPSSSLEGTPFGKALAAERTRHASHGTRKTYADPTLEELGLSAEYVTDRYKEYVTELRL